MKEYILLLSRVAHPPETAQSAKRGANIDTSTGIQWENSAGEGSAAAGSRTLCNNKGTGIHPVRLERTYKGQCGSSCSRGGPQQQERCGSFPIGIVASNCPVQSPRRKRWEGSSRAARKCRSRCPSEPERGVIYLASGGAKYRNRKINHGCVRYLPSGFLRLVYQ